MTITLESGLSARIIHFFYFALFICLEFQIVMFYRAATDNFST